MSGNFKCRKLNDVWVVCPAPAIRAALDAIEAREIAGLEVAGLPSKVTA